jgi:diguanylate cyclase (GGDEF)-like protein
VRNLPRDTPRTERRVDGLLQLALAAAVVLLAASLVRITVTRFGYEPALNRLHAASLAEADADRAMLNLEAGVRGYQLSDDPRFLQPYSEGLAGYPIAARTAEQRLNELPGALNEWTAAAAAAQAWQHEYAAPAVSAVRQSGNRPSLATLTAGEAQFSTYRGLQTLASGGLSRSITEQRSAEDMFRTATGITQTIALGILALALLRRQRRPQESLRREAFPVTAAAGTGWQDAFAAETATPTDPTALAASITHAAREISGAVVAHLWLADDDELRRVDPGQPTITAQRRRHDVALRAHREGAIITSVTRNGRIVAVPLLHEGRTLGVVELTMPAGSGEPTSAQTEMLRAWGRQAAKAVASGPGVLGRDRLTGLNGRSALLTDVTTEVDRALVAEQPVSVVVLHVDHLDRHSAASTGSRDDLIRTVGAVLGDTVRTSDTAYRTGEGAFAILLPGAPAHAAASLAERLRQIIARRFIERGVTCSFGVATCPDVAQDDLGLLEAAESALYDAQRFGGNRTQPARPLADELAVVRRRATELG